MKQNTTYTSNIDQFVFISKWQQSDEGKGHLTQSPFRKPPQRFSVGRFILPEIPVKAHLLAGKARQDLQNLSPMCCTFLHRLDRLVLLMYYHLLNCILFVLWVSLRQSIPATTYHQRNHIALCCSSSLRFQCLLLTDVAKDCLGLRFSSNEVISFAFANAVQI